MFRFRLFSCFKNGVSFVQPRVCIRQAFNIQKSIDKTLEEGTFIFIVSYNILTSKHCLLELQYAFSKKERILPIIICDETEKDIYSQLPYELRNIIALKIHKNPTKDDLNNLIRYLNNI